MDRLNKSLALKIILLISLTFIFWLKGVISLDPDLGWHIRSGELAMRGLFSIPDPFSYTMPSYIFIDHEWLTNLILFVSLSNVGFSIFSLIFALLVVACIFLSIPKSVKLSSFSAVFLTSSILLSFVGIRPQILSWLFFVIVLITFKSNRLLLLPLIFLLWANLHGGFVIGLATLFIYLFSEIISKKKVVVFETFILLLSILATLINPHGILIWKEILNQLTDTNLRWSIQEWFPLFISPNPVIIIWYLLSLFLMVKYRSSLALFEKMIFFILATGGVFNIRNSPFFVLASLPKITVFLDLYIFEVKKKLPNILQTKVYPGIFLFSTAVFLLTTSELFKNLDKSKIADAYPEGAVSFLKAHPPQGEILAPYKWGGYLIWEYPEKRVFIDGRMPSWRWNPPNQKESSYALKEYFQIFSSESERKSVFNKYNINTVVWLNSESSNPSFMNNLISSWQSRFILNHDSTNFIETLKKRGWEKIYEDEVAVIYQRSIID